jgi:hypothetical protein
MNTEFQDINEIFFIIPLLFQRMIRIQSIFTFPSSFTEFLNFIHFQKKQTSIHRGMTYL